jgi:hypothetical protein
MVPAGINAELLRRTMTLLRTTETRECLDRAHEIGRWIQSLPSECRGEVRCQVKNEIRSHVRSTLFANQVVEAIYPLLTEDLDEPSPMRVLRSSRPTTSSSLGQCGE